MENQNRRISNLAKNVVAVALLAGGGKLLANIIVNTITGAVAGHVDAACAVNIACSEMVINTVKTLPVIIPALYAIGRGVGNIVVADCSNNPDGGVNESIRGNVE